MACRSLLAIHLSVVSLRMRNNSNSLNGDRDACVVLRRSSLEDSLAERFSGGGSPRCCEVHARERKAGV